jgi:hypothetical protein
VEWKGNATVSYLGGEAQHFPLTVLADTFKEARTIALTYLAERHGFAVHGLKLAPAKDVYLEGWEWK